MKNKFRTAPLK